VSLTALSMGKTQAKSEKRGSIVESCPEWSISEDRSSGTFVQ
jgi:hypothetical protein